MITTFMMPASTLKKKGGPMGGLSASAQIKAKPKVSVEQSKDMLNNLLDEFDQKDVDELEDINATAVMAELNKPIAFNRE